MITIVVLLILAGVAINALFGDNGLITKAQLSSFATEMKKIKENVSLELNASAIKIAQGESAEEPFTGLFNVNSSDYKVYDTLKREILYTRAGYPSDKELSDYTDDDFSKIVSEDGTVEGIYVINKDTGDEKENTYIYDKRSGVVYKLPKTIIGGKTYHSYEIAQMQKGNADDSDDADDTAKDQIETTQPNVEHVGEEYYYGPDMSGFNVRSTSLIYYSSTDDSVYQEVGLEDYINDGQEYQIEDGQYILHDYGNKIWANCKTVGNDYEAWWVWIPRYAYNINSASADVPIDVIYVDVNGKPLNPKYNGVLPDGFIVHPAFTTENADGSKKELKGIWMSKYEPSYVEQTTISGTLAPDMSGFDSEHTYIELYDSSSDTFTEEVQLSKADLSTINNDNKWYDYENKIWANIKTDGNGDEAWWVWIPRYAYKITSLTNYKTTEIIFVDLNNKPINKEKYPTGELPDGYEVHSAFTVDGKELKGIWMSKYEASYQEQTTSSKVLAPDMDGFDKNHTYIELYDSSSDTFTEEVKLSNADLSTINDDNKWYDYENKVWANIKTDANGLEAWWVWIPRYAYKVQNLTNSKSMEIIYIGTDNKPLDTEKYPNGLPTGYEVHPAFTEGGKELKGIWISKYEPSQVSDVDTSQVASGDYTNKPSDGHTHNALGVGTTLRYVTDSTSWCDAYDGSSDCSNNGYYRYCTLCGAKLRYYWCQNHVILTDGKSWVEDSNIS